MLCFLSQRVNCAGAGYAALPYNHIMLAYTIDMPADACVLSKKSLSMQHW